MVKFKLRELRDIQLSLGKFLSLELDINVSFRLVDWSKTVVEKLRSMEEYRLKLITKYDALKKVKKNGALGNPLLTPEEEVEFNQLRETEFDRLLDEDVELSDVKVKLSEIEKSRYWDLEKHDWSKLTVLDVMNLVFLIEEGVSAKAPVSPGQPVPASVS